jgi:hypothetical protein
VNPKLKRLREVTPAQVSGGITLFGLIVLLAHFIWLGLHQPKSAWPFFFAMCVGGAFAYRVFRIGCFRLTPQRTVGGRLAKMLGIVSAALALVGGYFTAVVIYQKFVT